MRSQLTEVRFGHTDHSGKLEGLNFFEAKDLAGIKIPHCGTYSETCDSSKLYVVRNRG
jgi:hypothetical protein